MPPACVVQVLRAIGNHMRVGSRLSVMTALRAPVGLMAGVGVVGVMTMMIGARVTVAPLLAAIGAAIGMVAGVGVGMMAGARTIRSMSYTCLWMRQWRRCEPGPTSSRTSSTTHCARLSHTASGERCMAASLEGSDSSDSLMGSGEGSV